MIQNWNYEMSISDAIIVLEKNNFSKKDCKDLILSYHTQRIFDKSTQKVNELFQTQQLSKSLEDSKQQNLKQNTKKIETLFNNFFSEVHTQLSEISKGFQRIDQHNFSTMEIEIDKVTKEIKKIDRSYQASRQQSEIECQSQNNFNQKEIECQSEISDLENQFAKIEKSFNTYKKRLKELSDLVEQLKVKFSKQTQSIKDQQNQFMHQVIEALNSEN